MPKAGAERKRSACILEIWHLKIWEYDVTTMEKYTALSYQTPLYLVRARGFFVLSRVSHFRHSTSCTALYSFLLISVKNDTLQHSIKRHFLRVQNLGIAFLCRSMYKGVGFYVVEGSERVK